MSGPNANGSVSGPSSKRPAGSLKPVGLNVLIVDDDAAIRTNVGYVLSDAGHRVTEASDGAEAMALIHARVFDVAICDVQLPHVDGLTLLRKLRRDAPQTVVILMTGHAVLGDAVASLQGGAADYVTKPLDGPGLMRSVDQVAERLALRRELERVRAELIARNVGCGIIGHSPPIAQLVRRIETLAQSHASVVINGESGTGKELVARTIHACGPRHDQAFVAVNCAGFPETLLEAELFGHEQGAFTGATKKRAGRFMAAHRGTLLLDEVGEIPLAAQVKLLRFLQEGTIEPLGSSRPLHVDVRIIAATHRDLKKMVAAGRFREDLYFRLNVVQVIVPPLRDRKADIVPLLAHFLKELTPKGKVAPGIAPRAWAALTEYSWPGNVREFGHAIEHGLVLSWGREMDLEHLPAEVAEAGTATKATLEAETFRPLSLAVKEFEREYLLRALRVTSGGRGHAAELLDISRKSLWERLRKHGITDIDAALGDRFAWTPELP